METHQDLIMVECKMEHSDSQLRCALRHFHGNRKSWIRLTAGPPSTRPTVRKARVSMWSSARSGSHRMGTREPETDSRERGLELPPGTSVSQMRRGIRNQHACHDSEAAHRHAKAAEGSGVWQGRRFARPESPRSRARAFGPCQPQCPLMPAFRLLLGARRTRLVGLNGATMAVTRAILVSQSS